MTRRRARLSHRWSLAISALLAGCTVFRPGVCGDRDGDGLASQSCGGPDCDDRDPHVGDFASRCADAVTIVECHGAPGRAPTTTVVPCPRETPFCDPSRGVCISEPFVTSATCGNWTVELGETCDDGNRVDGDGCDRDCDRPTCVGATGCPASAPVCGDRRADGTFHCAPLPIPGPGAIGASCSSDADCEGWCDRPSLRCTAACGSDEDCGGGVEWCDPERGVCVAGCLAEADCAWPALSCALQPSLPPSYLASQCVSVAGGVAVGAPCVDPVDDCAHGFCDPWITHRCTIACAIDVDCPLALPHCVDVPEGVPRPAGWPLPARLCGD